MTPCALYIYPGYELSGEALAVALGCPSYPVHIHAFPDGESLVKVENAPGTALLYASLDHPNDKLINLVFAAQALRDTGSERIVLVCPYLCYMRQDKAFHAGEAISQQIIGRLLSAYFDRIVTVDPHLHRVSSLDMVFPEIETNVLSAAGLIAETILVEENLKDACLVGPDSESEQWVGAIAGKTGHSMLVARKLRTGDREVQINLPGLEQVKNRPAIIIDDMISSGSTARRCADLLFQAGACRIEIIAVHALCQGEDLSNIYAAGIERVRSSDSVLHPTNFISLAPLLADALKKEL